MPPAGAKPQRAPLVLQVPCIKELKSFLKATISNDPAPYP